MTLTPYPEIISEEEAKKAAKASNGDVAIEKIFQYILYGNPDEDFGLSDDEVLSKLNAKRFLLHKLEEIFGDENE